MKRKLFFEIFFILIFFVCSLLIYNQIKKFLEKDDIIQMTHYDSHESEAPMQVDNFKIEETEGSFLLWKLDSESSDVYRERGYIIFNIVKVTVNSNTDSNNYFITSDKGTYYIKDERMLLEGNVKIKTSSGYIFSTQTVLYDTVSKKINSKMSVTAKGFIDKKSELDIEGVGLLGDLNTGDFFISKKVKTKVGDKLEIQSEHVLFDTDDNIAIFKNDIYARKDDIDIKGDELHLLYDKNKSELKELNVKGNVKLLIGDKDDAEQKKAFCDNAFLSGTSSKIVLTGKPEFYVLDDVMVGEKIIFYTDSDEVFVEGVKAEVSGKGAVKK